MVEQLSMQFSNGECREYERLGKRSKQRAATGVSGAVMIAPVLDDNTVLLVEEYGAGIEDYHLALPKGAVDAGETILEAANRELMEEVGYGAHQLQPLKSLSLSPAYMSHGIELVLAQDLYPQQLPGDEPEPIRVVPWKLDNLAELVSRPDVHEGRSIAALYMVRELIQAQAQAQIQPPTQIPNSN